MSHDIRDVPPAPRRVRWSAVVFHRWPLALAAFLFGVYGGLWTLMLWYASHQSHPRAQAELDSRTLARTTGTVLSVGPVRHLDERSFQEVEFDYTVDGRKCYSVCKLDSSRGAIPGAFVTVEYVEGEPRWARIEGGFIVNRSRYASNLLIFTVLPGLILFSFWAAGVLRIRKLVMHGDIAVAEAVGVKMLPGWGPQMLRVLFQFRDHHSAIIEGQTTLRRYSFLGQRLLNGETRLAVVHDRNDPQLHRLVEPREFERSTRGFAGIGSGIERSR